MWSFSKYNAARSLVLVWAYVSHLLAAECWESLITLHRSGELPLRPLGNQVGTEEGR